MSATREYKKRSNSIRGVIEKRSGTGTKDRSYSKRTKEGNTKEKEGWYSIAPNKVVKYY